MTYQTDNKLLEVKKMLFPHSKHLKVCGKYFTEHHTFNSLLCVWKFGKKQFRLFGYLKLVSQWNESTDHENKATEKILLCINDELPYFYKTILKNCKELSITKE